MTRPSFDPKWLPGPPHREAILAYLADGRAHVAERGHGVAPLLGVLYEQIRGGRQWDTPPADPT